MSKNKTDLQKNIDGMRDQIGDLASKAHDAAPATVQHGIDTTADAVAVGTKTVNKHRGLAVFAVVLVAVLVIAGRRRSA
jgi:uncharacterized membrane protein